jgi:hypothetical protein
VTTETSKLSVSKQALYRHQNSCGKYVENNKTKERKKERKKENIYVQIERLNNPVCGSAYTCRIVGLLMNNESGTCELKQAGRNLCYASSEENHDNPHTGQPVS